MGSVYVATDTLLRRQVALKVLNRILDENPSSEMLREARLAARVEHERIARVYDVGDHEGSMFVAMEYVRGVTLRSWLSECTPTPNAIAAIVTQIAEGLAALHAEGVIHRDLKPENVMLAEQGAVKLVDFGLARRNARGSGTARGAAGVSSAQADAMGGASGTPGYMAPERFLSHPVDPRIDIFSLGVITYELVTGARPFATGRPSALAHVDFQSHRWQQLPDALCSLVARMLAYAPEDRFANGAEALDALRGPLTAILDNNRASSDVGQTVPPSSVDIVANVPPGDEDGRLSKVVASEGTRDVEKDVAGDARVFGYALLLTLAGIIGTGFLQFQAKAILAAGLTWCLLVACVFWIYAYRRRRRRELHTATLSVMSISANRLWLLDSTVSRQAALLWLLSSAGVALSAAVKLSTESIKPGQGAIANHPPLSEVTTPPNVASADLTISSFEKEPDKNVKAPETRVDSDDRPNALMPSGTESSSERKEPPASVTTTLQNYAGNQFAVVISANRTVDILINLKKAWFAPDVELLHGFYRIPAQGVCGTLEANKVIELPIIVERDEAGDRVPVEVSARTYGSQAQGSHCQGREVTARTLVFP